MRAALLTIPVTLALVVAGASPAEAVAVEGSRSATVGDDASACFRVPTMPSAGEATATGLVATDTTPLPAAVDMDPSAQATIATPTTLVSDVRPLLTMTGYTQVCVGGVGARAIGGTVTFTVSLHGVGVDHVVALTCTYSRYAPPACRV